MYPGAIQNLLSDIRGTRIDLAEAQFRQSIAKAAGENVRDDLKKLLNRLNYSVVKLKAEREDFRKALSKAEKTHLDELIEETEAFIAVGMLREE